MTGKLFFHLILFLAMTGQHIVAHAISCQDLLDSSKILCVRNAVDQRFLEQSRLKQIPGVAYTVFNDSGELFSGTNGLSRPANSKPISHSQTLFRTSAVSIQFLAVSIAKLIEQKIQVKGKSFSLNTPLLDIDAEFVLKIKEIEKFNNVRLARWKQITIGDLLAHHAGISKDIPGISSNDELMFFNSEALINDNSYASTESFMNGLSQIEFIYAKTGTFRYSNLGINMLARVVEAINKDGLTYSQFLAKNLFGPLGMKNTFIDVPIERRADLARGHTSPGSFLPSKPKLQVTSDGRVLMPYAYRAGAYDGSFGIATTSQDLAKFGQELLKVIKFKHNRLLNRRSVINSLFIPKTLHRANDFARANGFMWVNSSIGSDSNILWAGHSGTGFGERAYLFYSPELGYGIAIHGTTNDTNVNTYGDIIKEEMSKVLKATFTLNRSTRKLLAKTRIFMREAKNVTKPGKDIDHAPETEAELQKFTGIYHIDAKGTSEVHYVKDERHENKGYLEFHFGKKKFRLIAINVSQGKFRFQKSAGLLFQGEPLQFSFTEGKVTGFHAAWVKYFAKIE